MIPLPPKHAFVTLLVAAATTRGYPLAPRQAQPVLIGGLFDPIVDLIDKAKSGAEHAIDNARGLLGIGSDGPNHTPTLAVAKDAFKELTKGALYSNAAYCSADSVKGWSCGATCDALGDIKVAFTGGDNKVVPACKWQSPKTTVT